MIKIISYNLYKLLLFSKGNYSLISYNRQLKSLENNSVKENLEIQNQKLFNIVDYAFNNIVYYKNFKQKTSFKYSMDTIKDDIKRIPILTKDIIRENFNELCNVDGKEYYYNTSGGSTGEPVKLIQDKAYIQNDCTLYANALAGYEIGDKTVKLWGSEKEIFGKKNLRGKMSNKFIYRTKLLNTFKMSENNMREYIDVINNYKPKVILSYVQSIYELAKFIEKNNIKVVSPKTIIVSAGTLYDFMREKIEQIFQAPVFNRYGSREVGNIAMECNKHEGLHLNTLNHYIEILDKNYNEVKDGELGEVYITTLTNYSMPLIRYKIGDIAEKTKKVCSCGRGFPLIKSIKGRTVNMFKNSDGDLIDGEYFTHLFYFIDFIERFQVIQYDYNDINIKLVITEHKHYIQNSNLFDDINKKIKIVMGDQCNIRYEIVNNIQPTSSGKFLYTISMIS